MEFLKALFKDGEALTYDQLTAAITGAKLNVVNIADGSYVSRAKYDDKVNTLTQQVTDLQGQISQRDTDIATIQEQLTAAQADSGKLADAQKALTDMQTKYETEKQTCEQRLAQQSYEFAVREKANALQFSSESAKRAFVHEAISKGFKMDGETLMGYEDFVTKYKESDPGAFKTEAPAEPPKPEPPKPDIVLPSGNPPTPADGNGFKFHFNGVRPIPKQD